MKSASVLLWSIAIHLTLAGAAFSADPRAAQLTYQSWTKFCIARSSCFVGIEARGRCHPSGGAIVIAAQDEKPVSLTASFGTKRGLNDATILRIDHGNPIHVPYLTCYPSGSCINRLEIDNDIVAQMRGAQTIAVEATDTAGQKLTLSWSLADFARVYDGPGAEPKVYEGSQESLKSELRRRGLDSSPAPPCED
jgi:invasion protein IalB